MNEPPSLLKVVLTGAAVLGTMWAIDKMTGGKVRREIEKALAEEEAKNKPVWVPPYRPPSPPEVRVETRRVVEQSYDPDADEGDPDDPMN